MRKIALLLAVATAACAQDGAYITVYRESRSFFRNYTAYKDADNGKLMAKAHFILDGEPLATITDGKFVTLKVPFGKHILALSDRYADGELSVDLVPGDHIYARPQYLFTKAHLAAKLHPTLVPCVDAIASGKSALPLRGKDVGSFPAVEELRFPQKCEK